MKSAGLVLLVLAVSPVSLLVVVRAALMFGQVKTAILCHPCGHPEHERLRDGFRFAAQ